MSIRRTAFTAFFCMLCASLPLVGSQPASAGVHTWDVSEVFSNADGTIQFVELFNTGGAGEGGVVSGHIISDLKGTFTWSNPAVGDTTAKFYLIATPGFAALPDAPTPDVIFTAGFIPFFDITGDSVDFRVYDTCTFGPVPTDGVDSYDCIGASTGPNTPTNFAGATATVDASVPLSVTVGHVDTFEVGTLQHWAGGANPENEPTGGPGGVGDHYLELSSVLTNLGANNGIQWSGDYDAEGVGSLEFDLNNTGPNPLALRVMLLTPGCDSMGTACTAWTSTDPTALGTGSGWVTETFSIAEADLTRVLGSDSYTASMQNVERLLLRHDDGTPDPPGTGTAITGTLGVDNVEALPEPGLWLGLVAGAALLGVRRRGRAR